MSLLLIVCGGVTAVMRFASPLQSLTLWDKSSTMSPREKYLIKYKAGLEAEKKVREELKLEHDAFMSKQDTKSSQWARKAVAYERKRTAREERMAGAAYDAAFKKAEAQIEQQCPQNKINSSYQFVGVVKRGDKKPITWYARKKPTGAKWSLRIIHVNQGAIIKDLFNRGKVDIFAKYKNKGFPVPKEEEEEAPGPKSLQIKGEYLVRERSWRTLWNFSPKHFFTDSSGMYWRERRLRQGVYTDGGTVYESTYRYKDGRNGFRPIQSLSKFMQDSKVDDSTKRRVSKRIKTNTPDIVVEKN